MTGSFENDDLALQRIAVRLRSLSPELWDNFLAALQTYADKKAAQLVMANTDGVFRAQGFAAHAAHVAHIMRNAPDDVKRDEDRKNAIANRR